MKNNNNSSTRGRGIVHGLISAAVVALLAAVYFVVEHNLRDVAVGLEEEFARGVDQSFLLSQLALRFERINVDIHRAGAHASALGGMDIRAAVQAQKDARAVAREVHRIAAVAEQPATRQALAALAAELDQWAGWINRIDVVMIEDQDSARAELVSIEDRFSELIEDFPPLVSDIREQSRSRLLSARLTIDATTQWILFLGLGASMLVVIAAFWTTRRQARLRAEAEEATDHAHALASRLELTTENMEQGLALYDRKQRLVFCTRRYQQYQRMPDELVRPGTPLRDIIEWNIRQGRLGDEARHQAAALADERAQRVAEGALTTIELDVDGERVLEGRVRLLEDGAPIITFTDITRRKRSEDELAANLALLDSLVNALPDSVAYKGPDGRYLGCNDAFSEAAGLPRDEIRGLHPYEVFPPEVISRVIDSDEDVLNDGELKRNELWLPHRLHGRRLYEITKVPFGDTGSGPKGLIALSRDITETKELEERLREMATTDPLTGIPNRRHFIESAEREVARGQRYSEAVTAMMLDIDRFKGINDSYGHSVGDEVIAKVARICAQSLRKLDLFGRMGGEEFAFFLPRTGADTAMQVAERIRERIAAAPIKAEDHSVDVTVSIGIAEMLAPTDAVDDLLNRADRALYRAKSSGRNCTIADERRPDQDDTNVLRFRPPGK